MEPRPLPDHAVKFATVSFKAYKGSPRTFRFKISDATIDYDQDVIDPKGWDLTNFKQSGGPVMFGHDYKSLPVAKDVGARIEGDALYGYPQFPEPGVYPFADTVHDMVQAGFLNAASVGFKPITAAFNHERGGHDIKAALLTEYSIVPIGANPNALVQRAKAAGIDLKPIEQWCEQYLDETYGGKGVWILREQVEEAFKFMNTHKSLVVPGAKPAEIPKPDEAAIQAVDQKALDAIVHKPEPTAGEDESQFVSRCMGSAHMNEKFPEQAQRAAVCYSLYRRGGEPKTQKDDALEILEGEVLEIDDDVLDINKEQIAAAVGQTLREGLREAINQTVRERIDYARGRVS